MNREAQKYYALTEDAYRLLHQPETPYMNLGLWPAQDLLEAQAGLVRVTAESLASLVKGAVVEKPKILELGPGWGGSRSLLAAIFPDYAYQGLNLSEKQIAFAAAYNASVPDTNYIRGYFEDLDALPVVDCSLAFGVESILHVRDKWDLFRKMKQVGVRYFAFAEICLHQNHKVRQYFQPALTYAFQQEEYEELLAANCQSFRIENLSSQVFQGWSDFLDRLNERTFPGNKRVLRQFQEGYREIARLASTGEVSYLILSGVLRD
jgi:hypothetical protein